MSNTPVTAHQNHNDYEENQRPGSMFWVPVWHDGKPTDEVDCYFLCCPGCGNDTVLQIAGSEHPRWSVTEGDRHKPETITLSPSILHDASKGGCGWHGYLRAGILEEV